MLSATCFGLPVTFPLLLVEFALSTAFVLFFSQKLSTYADALEKKQILSAVWIGAIFLATVTSLPEAVTTIGSALMEGAFDLGIGNLFGSNTFNLLIIVILDLLQGQGPLLLGIQSGLAVAAAGGMLMTALAGIAIAFHHAPAATGWEHGTGPAFSLAIVAVYFLLSRLVTRELPIHDTSEAPVAPRAEAVYDYTVARIVTRLLLYAVLLVLFSIWLLRVCNLMAVTPCRLAGHTLVLGHTVTGSFLLSAATSFPELFVCIHALRLGQINMAIANVLGSNMVNMLFIPIMHLAVRSTTFYSRADAISVTVLTAMTVMMSVILMLGLLVRSRRSVLLLGWEAVGMLLVYLAGAAMLLRLGLSL